MNNIIYHGRVQIIVVGCSLLLMTYCSPQQSAFNKDDWNFKEDGLYQKRKYLINDLVENHLHKGMQFREVENLLGMDYLTKMEEYADTALCMVRNRSGLFRH